MDAFTGKYDVIIAGGGPAGSSAALSLARAGCSVAIIERSDYSNPRVGETLPPAVKAPLGRLGLWNLFVHESPMMSPAIHCAWGSESLHEQNHFYNPYGAGWNIDRQRFDAMIVRAAEDAGATLIKPVRIASCERDQSSGWRVYIRRGHTHSMVQGRFVLDATGRSSTIARHLGVRRILYDNLVGIVGFFAPATSAHSPGLITLVEAVENGWWYSASLPDSRLLIAYMTDADAYAAGERHSAKKWMERLSRTTHTRARAEARDLVTRPLIVQANSSRLGRVHGDDWLAMGDAAMAFDPISGQGVYRALESGMRAAEAVQASFAGKSGEVASYAGKVDETFNQFLILRRKYYSQEGRWTNSGFWRRRQRDLAAGEIGSS